MSAYGDHQQGARRGLGIPYGAGVAMLGGGVVLLAVARAWSAALDQWLIAQLRLSSAAPLWVVEAWRDLSALGSLAVLCLAVLTTMAVLLIRGGRRAALAFLLCELGAIAFSSLVKQLVDRGRPEAALALAPAIGRSFPSGHAFMSAAVLLAIGGLLARAQPPGPARHFVWGMAFVLVLLVGVSRPILGVHWPSDVLAGWLFGLGWALLALRYAARS